MPDFLSTVRDKLTRLFREAISSNDFFRASIRYIVMGALGVAAFIVLLLVLFYRPARSVAVSSSPGISRGTAAGPSVALAAEPAASAIMGRGGVNGSAPVLSEPPAPEDYAVPPSTDPLARGWVLSREPEARWTPGEIDKLWIDPNQIGVDNLKVRNDKAVEKLLSEVP